MSSDPERPDLSVGVEFDVQGIAGLFYVIDGFLDMILPTEDNGKESANAKTERGKNVQPEDEKTRSQSRFDFLFDGNSRSDGTTKSKANKDRSQKPLFTVKPGGIAGYLCELHLIISRLSYRHQTIELTHMCAASLTQTASYVDIVAKTDTYVGFLPSPALERLLERRPIVLLTLAKRLISLLSPLGMCLSHSRTFCKPNIAHT